jgi:hypothetical protein
VLMGLIDTRLGSLMRDPVTITSCTGGAEASGAAGPSASAAIAGAPAVAAAATALRKSALRTALETWLLDLVIESSCKRLKPSDEWKPAGSLPDDPLGTCLSICLRTCSAGDGTLSRVSHGSSGLATPKQFWWKRNTGNPN